MAGKAETGDSLKRRSPGVQARASDNEFNFEEENVMTNNSTIAPNVIPFDFREHSVRAVIIDGEPWFVASDVCRVLDVVNTTQAVQALDDDERSMFNIGRQGKANIVNESGLYTLMLRSRDAVNKGSKPHAFRRWVTSEVLPAIRKHGRYEDSDGKMTDLVNSVIGSSGVTVLDRVIDQKAGAIEKGLRRSFKMTIKSRLRGRFNVQRTDLIPADNLADACNFVAAYALEGEWLGKESDLASTRLDIHYPVESLLACGRRGMIHPRNTDTDFLDIALNDLRGFHASPCEEILNTLTQAGYDVEGAWWEVRTYRNKLAYLMPIIESLGAVAREPQQYVIDRKAGRAAA